MKNIVLIASFAFILSQILLNVGYAQQQEYTIGKSDNKITLDGNLTDWEGVETVSIERPFRTENPTVTSSWRALWNDEGMYIAIEVEDDVWMPEWESGLTDWESDKIELYFDISNPQRDGFGSRDVGSGNIQVAPYFSETDMGQEVEDIDGRKSCDYYNGEGYYIMEYFVPFASLFSDDIPVGIDPYENTVIGFDVTVIDLDEFEGTRNRMVWSNNGDIDESWAVMDDVGLITFETGLASEYDVTFNLNMNQEINSGSFSVTDEVWMSGSMVGWSEPGTNSNMQMFDANSDGIYSLTMTLAPGEYMYKFFVNQGWTPGDPVGDRSLNVNKSMVLDLVWGINGEVDLPTANFTTSQTTVNVNEQIQFTDQSSSDVISWLWDFGDGNTSTEQNVSHSYSSAGTFTVSLQVNNAAGSDTETKTDFIQVNALPNAPIANFNVDITEPAVNQIINFTDLSENSPTEWLWDFGDGGTADDRHPAHVYTSEGAYTVTLTAINNFGEHTSTKQNFITVSVTDINNDKHSLTEIYPNPSEGIFTVKTTDNINSVHVFNLQGKMVYSAKVNTTDYQVDLSNQPSGMYYLQIKGDRFTTIDQIIIY